MPPNTFPGRADRSTSKAPAACLRPSAQTRRRYVAAKIYSLLATVQIKPDICTLPRCKPAELPFSCCGSVAALALTNYNEHVAEENVTAPANTQRALHGAQISRGYSGKIIYFYVRDTRARASGISCFPCQISIRSFLRFSSLLRLFSPACFLPPGCFFARVCAHADGHKR
jgi:hypothetical protein